MATARIEVIGLRRLRTSMRAAGVGLDELKAVNRAAAAAVLPWARARTPVGPPEGGHIRTTVRIGATAKAGIIRAGTRARPYGPPVHWGWPSRGQAARPWMTDAAKATEAKWVGIYMRHLENLIDNVNGA